MQSCVLAFPNYLETEAKYATVVLSGGSWLEDLPLSNLFREEFAYVARSTDLALQSTQFTIDLGQVRDVQGIFIPKTNGSTACRYRIRAYKAVFLDTGAVGIGPIGEFVIGGNDGPPETLFDTGAVGIGSIGEFAIGGNDGSPGTLFDTGWVDLYPIIYAPGSLYWGSSSLWDGKMAPEDTPLYPMPVVEPFTKPVLSRYWSIEFDDVDNSEGYLELPRVILSGGWQPGVNMSWGANLVIEDPSIEQEALGGRLFYAQRPKRRVARFSLGFLTDTEAMVRVSDMQRRLGIQGQLFFIHDPDDRVNMHRRSFLARMRVLSPLEYTALDAETAPFELQEIIA